MGDKTKPIIWSSLFINKVRGKGFGCFRAEHKVPATPSFLTTKWVHLLKGQYKPVPATHVA